MPQNRYRYTAPTQPPPFESVRSSSKKARLRIPPPSFRSIGLSPRRNAALRRHVRTRSSEDHPILFFRHHWSGYAPPHSSWGWNLERSHMYPHPTKRVTLANRNRHTSWPPLRFSILYPFLFSPSTSISKGQVLVSSTENAEAHQKSESHQDKHELRCTPRYYLS